MAIRVEFYGIARQRAGVGEIELDVPAEGMRLADVFAGLSQRLPDLSCELFIDGWLQPSFALNLDGQRFVSDPQILVRDGQSILILSADAGG